MCALQCMAEASIGQKMDHRERDQGAQDHQGS